MIRIDMSEYMEKHAVSRLIGAPASLLVFYACGAAAIWGLMLLEKRELGIDDALIYEDEPDPIVRQQAALALGVNLIVTGIERATPEHPSPYVGLPLRDSLRVRLLAALVDPVEDVRAEAARALWKAPRTFGTQPAAAETVIEARAALCAAPLSRWRQEWRVDATETAMRYQR